MQRTRHLLFWVCWMLWLAPLGAQTAQEAAPSQEPAAPAAEPAKPARVVGQPQTQAEWDAWQAVDAAATPGEKAALAERFVENFPESGLTPNAHYLIAQNFYQLGDMANFASHAEKAVAELPNSVDLLSQLAFFYAEKSQAAKAIDRATQALEVMETLPKPEALSAATWVNQSYQLRAESNYALGRAYLTRIAKTGDRSKDPNLVKAIDYLNKALQYDPRHDYACFRLGFAYRNANDADGAVRAYSRAIAIGQVAAGPAQGQLEQVLEIVKKSLPDSELAKKNPQEIVAEAAKQLQADLEKNQQERAQEVTQMEQLQQAPVSVAPVAPALP